MKRILTTATILGLFAACSALAPAPTRAATLDFTGTLSLRIGTFPALVVPGSGTAQLTDDGSHHLLSFTLPGGAFGPATPTITRWALPGATGIDWLAFTLSQNLSGSFSGVSGGPPGGGPMGLSGMAKICFYFYPPCISNISMPLTLTTGRAGFGIGGTRTTTGSVNVTVQNAPWTIGQPVMTLHTPNTTTWTPTLAGGFAHGPASLTSSTAQTSGVVQLVTVSKVYTTLTGAFPEYPLTGILTLHFVPEPGTLLLLASGVAVLAALGRRRGSR
jgi:hypothetical protein